MKTAFRYLGILALVMLAACPPDTGVDPVVPPPPPPPPPPSAPAAPANLVSEYVTSTRVDLRWVDNATNEDGYRVERCAGPSCTTFSLVTSLTSNFTAFSESGLSGATTYRYRVQAYNAVGGSGFAGPISVTTLAAAAAPAAPSGFSASYVSPTRVDLAWADNATNEDEYHLQRCTGVACTTFVTFAITLANATSYQVTYSAGAPLPASTSYTYRIYALNGAGPSAPVSATIVTPPATPTPPAAPTSFQAAATSSSQINLTWSDASNNEDGFRIERCAGATCTNYALVTNTAANANSYSNTGLSASTTYRYRIQSFNAGGSSSAVGPVSATTPAALATPVMNTPTVSGTSITLTWTFTWPGGLGSSNDRYELEESVTSSTSGFSVVGQYFEHTSPKSVTLTNRAAGAHWFRVRAVTTQGTTSYSSVQSATVVSQTQRIALTNNLSGTGGNQVLRFRVAANTTALYSAANTSAERLSPDNYCAGLPGEAIDPGETQTFDVSANAPNYYVYIGLGKWDNTDLQGNQTCWQKKNWGFDGSNLLYIFTAVSWQGHTSGTNQWTLTYDAQNRIVLRTASGDIGFVVSTNSDPIH